MEIVQINVEPRENLGKKATKALRNSGKIPAIIYSRKNGVSHFTTTHGDVKSIVFTPDLKLAEISLNGKTHKAILKEVCFHPVTDEIQHLDFLELVDGQPLIANIPVKLKGVSPGVKNGGNLIKTLRKIKVKTTPEALIDTLYVNIDKLELGSAIRVRDIAGLDGVEVLVNGAIPIANVEVPRVLIEEEELLDDEEATAEGAAEGEGESNEQA